MAHRVPRVSAVLGLPAHQSASPLSKVERSVSPLEWSTDSQCGFPFAGSLPGGKRTMDLIKNGSQLRLCTFTASAVLYRHTHTQKRHVNTLSVYALQMS